MKLVIGITVLVLCFLFGGTLFAAPILGEKIPYYQASDKLLLSQNEWEQFKQAVSEDSEANLSGIQVINHGQTVLIEYEFDVESTEFPFGEVVEKHYYDKPWWVYVLSAILPIFGIIFGIKICES